MRPGYPVVPGVPATGHVAGNGFWHPGSVATCPKTPCAPPDRPQPRRTR